MRTVDRAMFYGAKVKIFEHAYHLRKNMTSAEKKLWSLISNNQLGVRFKAQHPINKFIVDFYCHKEKLVIEIDGPIHITQKGYDIERTEDLKNFGIKIIRFTNKEVEEDIERVLSIIQSYIHLEI
jgi:very-short-patch-repair endonuclease